MAHILGAIRRAVRVHVVCRSPIVCGYSIAPVAQGIQSCSQVNVQKEDRSNGS